MQMPAEAIDNAATTVEVTNADDLERVGRVVGIPMSDAVPHDVLQTFRNANVARIQSIASDQLDEVTDILEQAERENWRPDQLAAALKERFDVSDSRADFIARDQLLKLNGQLTEYRQTESGVTEYIWTTSGDERVRPMHADLDGKTFPWAEPPETNDDGDTNNPGGDYQCRCTAYPVSTL